MSAWYVFSSLGFYPVTPASNQYIIGTPLFDKVTINLENGKHFNIIAHDLSESHIFIKSVTLNGIPLNKTYIDHHNIINGGTLEFQMTNTPSEWGTQDKQEPVTKIDEHFIVPAPFIAKGDVAFKGETEVALQNADSEASIFFSLDNEEFKIYNSPFKISEPTTLSIYSEKNKTKSVTVTTQFYKIDPNLSIQLETTYANQYNAGGHDALIDGIFGTKDFRTGTWQGYWNEDVIATLDLGHQKPISLIQVNFLKDQRSWIFYPTEVECLVSKDGKYFKSASTYTFENPTPSEEVNIKRIEFKLPTSDYRYVKIIAKTLGKLPEWHLGHPHDGRSWIFVDEISIK